MRLIAAVPPAAKADSLGFRKPVLCHGDHSAKRWSTICSIDPRVMFVFPALERGVVVHFYHAGVPVVILDIHAVQAPPDCVRGIEPGPDDVRGHVPFGNTLYPAIDHMPVDGCLDLEGDRRDRILADIEELPVEDTDPPVVFALDDTAGPRSSLRAG